MNEDVGISAVSAGGTPEGHPEDPLSGDSDEGDDD